MTIALEDVGTPVPLWLSTFLTPLDVTPLEDGRNWRIDETFAYESARLQRIVTVRAGEITDFASVPRALWDFFPPWGRYGKAAVVHDTIYRTPTIQCSRLQADQVFSEAMAILGVGGVTRRCMYLGVRLGGRGAFKPRSFPVEATYDE